jgi:hypothetical protein
MKRFLKSWDNSGDTKWGGATAVLVGMGGRQDFEEDSQYLRGAALGVWLFGRPLPEDALFLFTKTELHVVTSSRTIGKCVISLSACTDRAHDQTIVTFLVAPQTHITERKHQPNEPAAKRLASVAKWLQSKAGVVLVLHAILEAENGIIQADELVTVIAAGSLTVGLVAEEGAQMCFTSASWNEAQGGLTSASWNALYEHGGQEASSSSSSSGPMAVHAVAALRAMSSIAVVDATLGVVDAMAVKDDVELSLIKTGAQLATKVGMPPSSMLPQLTQTPN